MSAYYCVMRRNPDGKCVDVTVDHTGFSGFTHAEDARTCLAFHLIGRPEVGEWGNCDVADLVRRKDLFMSVISKDEFEYLGGSYAIRKHDMCSLRKTHEGCRVVYTRDGPYIKDTVEPIPIG